MTNDEVGAEIVWANDGRCSLFFRLPFFLFPPLLSNPLLANTSLFTLPTIADDDGCALLNLELMIVEFPSFLRRLSSGVSCWIGLDAPFSKTDERAVCLTGEQSSVDVSSTAGFAEAALLSLLRFDGVDGDSVTALGLIEAAAEWHGVTVSVIDEWGVLLDAIN